MADILCLKGDAAFSAFRLQRLQARLVTAVADIESVTADFWHVVAQKRALSTDERAKLAKLLEEQPAASDAGELFLVTPRIGTISPWSSKATDIAFNCDLEPAIERIERVVACHVVLKNGRALTADEKKIVAGLLQLCQGLRILLQQGIQISGEHGLHLFAFHEYDAALRNCLYCYFFGYDIMVSDDLSSRLRILIDKIHRLFVGLHKCLHFLGMLFQEFLANDRNACHQAASIFRSAFPQFVQIQGNP